jgi:hypothetical protein
LGALIVAHQRSGKLAEITRRRENSGMASHATHQVRALIMNNAAQQSTSIGINLRWNNAS